MLTFCVKFLQEMEKSLVGFELGGKTRLWNVMTKLHAAKKTRRVYELHVIELETSILRDM